MTMMKKVEATEADVKTVNGNNGDGDGNGNDKKHEDHKDGKDDEGKNDANGDANKIGDVNNADAGNDDDDDDDGDLFEFANEEEQEALALKERRLKRKRRLETLDADATATATTTTTTIETIGEQQIKQEEEEETRNMMETEMGKKKRKEEENNNIQGKTEELFKKGNLGDNMDVVVEGETTNGNDDDDDDEEEDDDFDMFGSPSSLPSTTIVAKERDNPKKKKKKNETESTTNNAERQDGFDDSEGYYKASIGEIMDLELIDGGAHSHSHSSNSNNDDYTKLKLRVLGVIGKGVFSSVLKCSTTTTTATGTISNNEKKESNCNLEGDNDDTDIPTTITMCIGRGGGGGNGDDGGNQDQGAITTTTTTSNTDDDDNNNNLISTLPTEMAVKCIRSNETMAKAAINEIKYLIRLRDSPGIIPLLLPSHNYNNTNSNDNGDGDGTHNSTQSQRNNNNANNYLSTAAPPPIEYRNHTLLIFPYLPYNLRDVLQKFGKGVGLSLQAVKNYFGQLLSAATHLQKYQVLHCDIKPDNILVTSDFTTVLLADFGSAIDAPTTTTTHDDTSKNGSHKNKKESAGLGTATSAAGLNNEVITPYLVSRFYRAPEIILGSFNGISYSIDLWSLAITAGELFLGKVLFNGSTNNDMLYVMMTNLGPFTSRLIKSHLLQTKKHYPLLPEHFSQVQSNYVFRKETVDTVLGQAVHKEISLVDSTFTKPILQSRLLKARSPKDTRKQVMKFADLVSKCLLLDPSKRISVRAALKHEFFS